MKFFSGLVLGIATGTTLALIESGKTSFGDVKKTASNVKDLVIDTKNDLISLNHSLTETFPETMDSLSKTVQTYTQEIEPLVANVKENIEKIQKQI